MTKGQSQTVTLHSEPLIFWFRFLSGKMKNKIMETFVVVLVFRLLTLVSVVVSTVQVVAVPHVRGNRRFHIEIVVDEVVQSSSDDPRSVSTPSRNLKYIMVRQGNKDVGEKKRDNEDVKEYMSRNTIWRRTL